ncbi:MAG: threonine synthase [Candidatus Thalassarchaeum betae]|uniref:Threonine synthase n=1 Tax=Candidatus Thalassarchaeum betae TaxID=2599289 RepID=A0A2V3HTE2_9ARCH|nr:MAG: threonine synthase [Candidatus Thalassoarchaea betae]PXF27135.1 MAG: threonine synthase [Euryarchaeota archaeon]HIC50855.1 threonine synthase [Candidatus Poseidoniales archaeon]HIM13582.1 threonine synthase [Candidatus Poseidoniales archaeon]HIM92747.1 threonine synthase [Candidatus Poseidoniales archaeon]
MGGHGVIRRYRSFLPVSDDTPVVSLNEGGTPLIETPEIVSALGGDFQLFVKYEGLNPTASFKDRGMTLAVSKAVERGARIVVCASTGNTSASAAAYAARAGMRCLVLIPEGKIAFGKMAQALIHGALTLEVRGNFDDALEIVRELGKRDDIEVVNSINPYRIQGQKTASFEVCDSLGEAPDMHFLPVGNAGNITAYWMGYKEYRDAGNCSKLPRMMGWQAEGAAPIVRGTPIESPETVASAIRIGNPSSWEHAVNAASESSGAIDMVSDEEILDAQRMLARTAGIFVEPASAAGIAGIVKCHTGGGIPNGSTVVVTVTGHGLKDPDVAVENSRAESIIVDADMDSVLVAIGLD